MTPSGSAFGQLHERVVEFGLDEGGEPRLDRIGAVARHVEERAPAGKRERFSRRRGKSRRGAMHLAERPADGGAVMRLRAGRALGGDARRRRADFPLRRANALSRPAGARSSKCRATAPKSRWRPGLAACVEAELGQLAGGWPEALPEGVIHADLFPDNVFFLKGKLSGLIDFYFACNDLLAYDLAVCLNAWCFEPDGAFNVTKGRALIQAYASVRRLEAEELAALPMLARGAALRFLLTRLYDWLTVPEGALVTPKDPREYLRKLRFHQKVGSAADYGMRGMSEGRSASSCTPTAPAPAIRGRAAGAQSSNMTAARRSSAAARRNHQQPHGADGGDRGAAALKGPLRRRASHRFRISRGTASPSGSTAGSGTAGGPPTASR